MAKIKQKAAKAAAVATSEAAAAGYAKQQVVELSAASEAKIRTFLQELDLLQRPGQAIAGGTTAQSNLSTYQLQEHYTQLYDQLLEFQFTGEQVQAALSAVQQSTAGAAAGSEHYLDWLCFNLPAQQLPRRFTGTSRLAAGSIGVKVVARPADGTAAAESWDTADATGSSIDSESSSAASESSDSDNKAHEEPARGAAATAASASQPGKDTDDKAAAKAWILQQYAGDSDEADDSDEVASQSSEDSEIEDWELWGDPREIDRRRAERAFAKQPQEQRQAAVAAEYAAAKAWAAAAKIAGDKQKQKEAGQLIGALKAEMRRLELKEDQALVLAAAADAPKAQPQQQPTHQQQKQQQQKKKKQKQGQGKQVESEQQQVVLQQQQLVQQEAGPNTAAPKGYMDNQQAATALAADWEMSGLFNDQVTDKIVGIQGDRVTGTSGTSMQPDVKPQAEQQAAEGGSEWEAPDIFEEGVAEISGPAVTSASTAQLAQPTPLTPWGVYGAAKSSKFTRKQQSKTQQQQTVEIKTPKALLQQHCQKMGWQAPRFERITQPAGGAAAATAGPSRGIYRYKVILAPTAAGKRGSGASSKSAKLGELAGPKTYQLLSDEDGWASVQDAQNAAAARALFALHKQAAAKAGIGKGPATPPAAVNAQGGAMQQMRAVYDQLGDPWSELWTQWWGLEGAKDSVEAFGAGAEEMLAAEHEEQKQDFVRSLLTGQRDQQQVGAVANMQGKADDAFADEQTAVCDAEAAADTDSASEGAEGILVTHGEEAEEWELAAGLDDNRQGQQEVAVTMAAAAAVQDDCKQQRQQYAAAAAARRNEQLQQKLLAWRASPAGQSMQQQRDRLPMTGLKQQLCGALANSDALVVSGETGSGKTTQVPQFLLEDASLAGLGASCNIIVTQPRRIAAISVAERVAAERGETGRPGAPGSTVGYHVRLDAAMGPDTQLLFCTTGILLRRLASDPLLSCVTHVVVDEVHERSLQGDVLMALLQRVAAARNRAADAAGGALGSGQQQRWQQQRWQQQQVPQQPQRLKVILMSATLDANIYSSYFWNCPVLSCPGRTFPVTVHYLEDAYAATRYILAPDARAALRPGSVAAAAAAAKRKESARGNAGKAALMAAGWGDEESLQSSGALNPNYDSDLYQEYPAAVRRNLAKLNEDMLDLDFLEELLSYADEETPLPGAILVFLPGMGEITNLLQRLNCSSRYNRGKHWLLPLHSSISAEQQRAAFKVPPAGVRKIVLSTNIAETSVTLEDVVVVIDSGRHKERRFDAHKRMSLLVEDWVSRAAALQRRGRAGRVRAGTCYCCFTRQRFETQMRQYAVPEVARVPLEELVLQIHLLGLGPAASFLQCLIQPPPAKAIEAALTGLQEVGALTISNNSSSSSGSAGSSSVLAAATPQAKAPDADAGAGAGAGAAAGAGATAAEVLTPLGHLLALLPLEPRLGKLLVMGAALGCLAPALTIAAAFSHKSPFSAPLEKQDELERIRRALAAPGGAAEAAAAAAGQTTGGSGSTPGSVSAAAATGLAAGQQCDQLLLVAAFEMWRLAGASGGDRAAAQVARRYFLSQPALAAMLELRRQFATLLQEAHLLPAHTTSSSNSRPGYGSSKWSHWADDPTYPANRFAGKPEVVKAALVAALAPHVAMMVPPSAAADVANSRPGWLDNRGQQVWLHPSSVLHELTASQLHHSHVVYLEKTKTTRVFLREVSAASPLSLLLLGGSVQVQLDSGMALLDGWLQIRVPATTAVLVTRLRRAIELILSKTVAAGSTTWGGGGEGLLGKEAQAVMALLQQLLEAEFAERSR